MSDDLKAKLAELKARKAARQAEREAQEAERKVALEIQELELEERFEKELGARGRYFELVDISDVEPDHPFVAVKLGPAVAFNRFVAGISKDDADVLALQEELLLPSCVAYPSAEEARTLFDRRPAIIPRCADRAIGLYGAKNEGRAKKS